VSVCACLTSCSVRLSLKSRVLTALQSCCISRRGRVSSPGGKGSSSLPKASPELQSAGSRLVGRLGSLEEREGEGRENKEMKRKHESVWKTWALTRLPCSPPASSGISDVPLMVPDDVGMSQQIPESYVITKMNKHSLHQRSPTRRSRSTGRSRRRSLSLSKIKWK